MRKTLDSPLDVLAKFIHKKDKEIKCLKTALKEAITIESEDISDSDDDDTSDDEEDEQQDHENENKDPAKNVEVGPSVLNSNVAIKNERNKLEALKSNLKRSSVKEKVPAETAEMEEAMGEVSIEN